jgi:protein TonB
MIAWLAIALEHSEPRLAVQESLMTGVLLAPPVPQPAVVPPKPLPIERPVVRREPETKPPPVVPEIPLPVQQPVLQPEAAAESAITGPVPALVEGVPEPELPQVTPPRIDASQLDNPAPAYPPAARRLREQGEVLLSVYILPDGSVGEIRLKRSSGHARLDRSALEAVKRWRYVPASRGGEPIPYWYVQPIAFVLNY